MIQRIEALNYRSLRYVSQEIRPFQVLVGPNASGKSTFLDVVALLGDFVHYGMSDAILFGSDREKGRASRLDELIFNQSTDHFAMRWPLETMKKPANWKYALKHFGCLIANNGNPIGLSQSTSFRLNRSHRQRS